ncbi:hypothetical protein N9335_02210 [Crocinitomicaceae bacterium]|nr:hypothetical protein [Crocinitomicaceae bacterium]
MRYLFVFLLVGLVSCVGSDASGDADQAKADAKNDQKAETAKQPSCDDIDGWHYADQKKWSKDYTGGAFYCRDGKIEILTNYKNGNEDGLYRQWYKNGQLSSEYNNKEGFPEGLGRSWYENGQLQSENNFTTNVFEGFSREWHKNGQLKHEYIRKEGKPIIETCWDEDGNKIECLVYNQ